MGIAADDRDVYTAAAAAVDYVLDRFCPWLGTCRGFSISPPKAFRKCSRAKSNGSRKPTSPAMPSSVACRSTSSPAKSVNARQCSSCQPERRGGHPRRSRLPEPRGLEFGVGAMAAMLSYAAAVTPVFCGKPERLFFEELCGRLAVLPSRCVLIGDNLESDIARKAGGNESRPDAGRRQQRGGCGAARGGAAAGPDHPESGGVDVRGDGAASKVEGLSTPPLPHGLRRAPFGSEPQGRRQSSRRGSVQA